MRKKRRHLHTDFIRFILEKYSNEGQDLPEDEIPIPDDDESEDPELRKNRKIKLLKELDDEVQGQDEEEPQSDEKGDEIIDELLNEYKRLKRKYESSKFRKRRR